MIKILLFGKNGQLGWELQRTLAPLGDIIAFDFPDTDFKKPGNLRRIIQDTTPDLIVNPAAYTAVDRAESEPEIAYQVNCEAVELLAEESKKLHIPFVHYSTDYVFNGKKGAPYIETDATDPLNVYGKSKLEGEKAVLAIGGAYIILRTSWVYSLRQGGFVRKVLQWARQQEEMRVVDDQISSPTSARMLAEATALMLSKAGNQPYEFLSEHAGLYHLAGSGSCSRYEWAKAILELDPEKTGQVVKELYPVRSDTFQTAALRPKHSVLNCKNFENIFHLKLPPWDESLRMMMEKCY